MSNPTPGAIIAEMRELKSPIKNELIEQGFNRAKHMCADIVERWLSVQAQEPTPTDAEILDWLEKHKSDSAFDLYFGPTKEYDEDDGDEDDEEDEWAVHLEYVVGRGAEIGTCGSETEKTIRLAVLAAMKQEGAEVRPCDGCGAPSLTGCVCG